MGMNRGIRAAAAAGLALAVALGVSGCTEVTSIYSDVVITSELDGLARELGELDGVTVTHTSTIQPDYTYQVSVDIQVEDPTSEIVRTVIESSVAKLRGDVLSKQKTYFTVSTGEQSIFSSESLVGDQTLDDVIADDLDYWLAIREATGVALSLSFSASESAPEGRIRMMGSTEPVDFAALRAVDDPKDSETEWSFPGISVSGPPPSEEDVALLERVTKELPAYSDADYLSPGVQLARGRYALYVHVHGEALPEGAKVTDSATWPAAIAIAGLTSTTARGLSFFDANWNVDANVFFGSCTDVVEPRPSDTALFDGMVAAGVKLPAGSGPGFCQNDPF